MKSSFLKTGDIDHMVKLNGAPHRMILITCVSLAGLVTPDSGRCGAGRYERPVVTVDNTGNAFSLEGRGWTRKTEAPGFHGCDYYEHRGGDRSSRAVWRILPPRPGRYNVYARWVMTETSVRASNAPFVVKADYGETVVRVDMTTWQSPAEYPAGTVQSPWNLLGTFPFSREGAVTLTAGADGPVVADAVRFEYMEPLDAPPVVKGELIAACDFDELTEWSIEGPEGEAGIVDGALRITSTSDRFGVHAWYRPDLPDSVVVEYDMTFHGKAGFALVFFCARGAAEQDILTEMPERGGRFAQYVRNDDFLAYHLSVHRHGATSWVNGANLNKNPGKRLVQRNAVDPCPPAEGTQTYRIRLVKLGNRIEFFVDERPVLFWFDDAGEGCYDGGKFGFRQIYRSAITYDNFRVYRAVR